MAKILIIEDDEDLASMVSRALIAERHTVEVVNDGNEGLEILKISEFDLVILDWNLPGISGPEILRELRADRKSAAVIMLTANSSIQHKETGFNSGADDYVTKPLDVRELVLRVRSMLKRPPATTTTLLKFGPLEVDPIKHIARKNGITLNMAPRDFALLVFFMRHPGDIFSADSLIARVWESDTGASGEAVRMSLSRIRKVIDDKDTKESLIESVSRVGYRLRSID